MPVQKFSDLYLIVPSFCHARAMCRQCCAAIDLLDESPHPLPAMLPPASFGGPLLKLAAKANNLPRPSVKCSCMLQAVFVNAELRRFHLLRCDTESKLHCRCGGFSALETARVGQAQFHFLLLVSRCHAPWRTRTCRPLDARNYGHRHRRGLHVRHLPCLAHPLCTLCFCRRTLRDCRGRMAL